MTITTATIVRLHIESVHEIVADTGVSVEDVAEMVAINWHHGPAELEKMLVWWPRDRRNTWVTEALAGRLM